MIPSLSGNDIFEIIPCVNCHSAYSPIFAFYNVYSDATITLLILVLYLISTFYIRFFKMKITTSNNRVDELALKRQLLKVMPLLRRQVLTHCGLTLVSKLLLFL